MTLDETQKDDMVAMKRWFTSLALLLPFLLCGAASAQNTAPARARRSS